MTSQRDKAMSSMKLGCALMTHSAEGIQTALGAARRHKEDLEDAAHANPTERMDKLQDIAKNNIRNEKTKIAEAQIRIRNIERNLQEDLANEEEQRKTQIKLGKILLEKEKSIIRREMEAINEEARRFQKKKKQNAQMNKEKGT